MTSDSVHNSFISFKTLLCCDDEEAFHACRVLLSLSTEMCQDFSETFIGRGWNNAGKELRSAFAHAVVGLMTEIYHSQFLRQPQLYSATTDLPIRRFCRNSVWSLAGLLSKLSPVPSVDPILLFPIASHYNCFHESIRFVFTYHESKF